MSDGLMDMALARDQTPDVGQGGRGWMDSWAAGWGSGSVWTVCSLDTVASLLFADGMLFLS